MKKPPARWTARKTALLLSHLASTPSAGRALLAREGLAQTGPARFLDRFARALIALYEETDFHLVDAA